ncbi:ATP-binding protein [Actinoplanes subglobosus]|uniref:Sensor-like histidine kinase SenX3 n=1 Tax=Actinoplanes subglobosus TaxID=1547892 RepID=A0ABV8IGT2_9ACTN
MSTVLREEAVKADHRRSLARTVCFALAYAVACYAGRRLVVVGNHNLAWPAAGVAVIWFCAHRRAPTRRLDMLLLVLILGAVNWRTGTSPAVGVVAGLVGLVQALVFLRLLTRWAPHLWGGGGDAPLRCPRDLWALLKAGFGATLAASAVSLVGRWLITGTAPLTVTTMSVARHTASILIIGAAGICAGSALTRRVPLRSPAPPRRIAEIAGLGTLSIAGHLAVFAYEHQFPVSFALLGITVLVGVRLSTGWVLLHNLVVSVVALRYTLAGYGPFAQVGDVPLRAVVVQLFVTLVALVGLALALGREERRTLVTALAQEKEQVKRHADLLAAIIDSMPDGLAVIGPENRVTLRNPAVAGMADNDLARLRALADQDDTSTDIVVNRPGEPESRVIRVTATALPHPDGTHSAVVLFHDMTAERRHRDELTSFAGVVAHDLLNPLASVDGWTTAAMEALEEAPDHPGVSEAYDGLTRVSRSSARMRGLIDGLLAYATAREAMVTPAPVDLAEVVAEIALARTDAAAAAGSPMPRFTIGPLPAVRADPVLVRQLLDNLIGNAVKYTAPGVLPALRITAEDDHGMVAVRIVDNGIGIPAGQHEAIFGNFHRAHADGGYRGTGLGLTICKRIVERHGGTITAVDDPGGGSCFTFTLPPLSLAAGARPQVDA